MRLETAFFSPLILSYNNTKFFFLQILTYRDIKLALLK